MFVFARYNVHNPNKQNFNWIKIWSFLYISVIRDEISSNFFTNKLQIDSVQIIKKKFLIHFIFHLLFNIRPMPFILTKHGSV